MKRHKCKDCNNTFWLGIYDAGSEQEVTRLCNECLLKKPTEKQKLARARNYFKFVLTGLCKPLDLQYLSEYELEKWTTILNIRDDLLGRIDNTSRSMGLNVPVVRCQFCSKAGIYYVKDEDYIEFERGHYLCSKHEKQRREDEHIRR